MVETLEKRLLDIHEASNYLSFSVHTLYKKVERREIPFCKVGRTIRFDIFELNKWIEKLPKE